MTKCLKKLNNKYKGTALKNLPYELRYDENYGYFFSYYNVWYIVELDSSNNSTISNIKELNLKRKH